MRQTPLYEAHLTDGARIVDFAGWALPIHYGSQLDEHRRVREVAGMFDVSHMTVVDLRGPQTRAFLERLLANDVGRLQAPGKALYSCMLNERGGVVDDLIAYFMEDGWFRLVVNAATRDKDVAWIERQGAGFRVAVTEHHETAVIAVQGPAARDRVHSRLPAAAAARLGELRPFSALQHDGLFVGRTGYTGEDGYEIILAAERAEGLWRQLPAAGVAPCGLGARDTLRLEAGLSLYGQDLDEDVTPLESGLAWTVAMTGERDFIGRAALERQQAEGLRRKLAGLVLEERGVLRPGQTVETEAGAGITTSGSFAPTLQRAIALARVPSDAARECRVEVRGRALAARIVQPPFVRHGKACKGIL
jgi:aminomethyltransferase